MAKLKSSLKEKPLSLTEEEIEEWELKQVNDGQINRVIVPVTFESELSDDGTTTFLIAKPTSIAINTATDLGQKKDIKGANDHLLNNCVIAGDTEELGVDMNLYYGVLEEIGKLAAAKKKIS